MDWLGDRIEKAARWTMTSPLTALVLLIFLIIVVLVSPGDEED